MVRVDKLRGAMAEKGVTICALAHECGITPKTLSRHMQSGKFRTDEIQLIVDALEIEDPASIFFAYK